MKEHQTIGESLIEATTHGYSLEIGRHPFNLFATSTDMAKLNGCYWVVVRNHDGMRLEGDTAADLGTAIRKAVAASNEYVLRVNQRIHAMKQL